MGQGWAFVKRVALVMPHLPVWRGGERRDGVGRVHRGDFDGCGRSEVYYLLVVPLKTPSQEVSGTARRLTGSAPVGRFQLYAPHPPPRSRPMPGRAAEFCAWPPAGKSSAS